MPPKDIFMSPKISAVFVSGFLLNKRNLCDVYFRLNTEHHIAMLIDIHFLGLLCVVIIICAYSSKDLYKTI